MNKSIVQHAVDQLKNLFQEDSAYQLAHESKLIQRSTNKLNPMAFLMVMIIEMSLVGTYSLTAMCELLMLHGSLRMTGQALSQRLDRASTVRFLKASYNKVLGLKLLSVNIQLKQEGILGRFQNIYLEDSTFCSLHEKVAGAFKGCGGSSSKAGYKIHTIWNVARNCVEQLLISAGNRSDQSQAFGIIRLLKRGDLVLRDLGYFSLPCFREIAAKGAYFLSRLKSKVKVYTLDGVLIEDLARYVEQKIHDSATLELDVLLGIKERLRVRLVAHKVPQSVYDQRVRKLRRKAQKKMDLPRPGQLLNSTNTHFL